MVILPVDLKLSLFTWRTWLRKDKSDTVNLKSVVKRFPSENREFKHNYLKLVITTLNEGWLELIIISDQFLSKTK